MQVLCIQGSYKQTPGCKDKPVIKGEVYNSLNVLSYGRTFNGIDAWHTLEERNTKGDKYHVTLFIELPSQEGQSFRKEETVEIPQKLQPFYEQL